ncbi:MAG: hypothetical protein KDD42_07410, partial [Bdellovibrionales bacterium]|nr:hypothetical protein [Bdellovibrionales bacterium]
LHVLPQLLDVLSRMGVGVMLSLAGNERLSETFENVFQADFLPGDLACRRADFVISNGGSPTGYQALRAGKPLIGIASNMDQLLFMQGVEQLGAGISVRSDICRSVDIERAVSKVIASRRFVSRAQLAAREIQELDEQQIFPQFVRQMLNHEGDYGRKCHLQSMR